MSCRQVPVQLNGGCACESYGKGCAGTDEVQRAVWTAAPDDAPRNFVVSDAESQQDTPQHTVVVNRMSWSVHRVLRNRSLGN
jgi:hypothetical protein